MLRVLKAILQSSPVSFGSAPDSSTLRNSPRGLWNRLASHISGGAGTRSSDALSSPLLGEIREEVKESSPHVSSSSGGAMHPSLEEGVQEESKDPGNDEDDFTPEFIGGTDY